jgi:two-component system sensor kinase FixL
MPDSPHEAGVVGRPDANQAQRLAQSVVDALESHIAILDETGVIVAVNRAWRAFAVANGASLASVCEGQNYLSVCDRAAEGIGRTEAHVMAAALRDILADRRDRFELEYPCHGLGQQRWFLVRVTRFGGDDSQPLRLVVAHENITARHLAEQSLRESERRFRQWAETSSDMICRHAPDGTFVYVSPACRTILGFEPEELVGRFPYDFFHPDDVDRIRQSHQRVLGTDQTETIAFRFRRKEGAYQWVESTSLGVTDDSGAIVEIHTATRDIEQRRRQEEALRRIQTAIDQVQDSVVITSPQLDLPGPQIVYVNPAFTRMSGYSAEEVLGKTPRILQGPRSDRAVLDRLKTSLKTGKVFHGSTVNYRKDGSEFLVEWQVAPVRDEQGRVINYVSIQRDVTERVRDQEIARQREAELAHVARLNTMGELASGLAHELNQPLAAVVNYTQGCLRRMAQGEWTPESIRGAMQLAADQATRAAEIIRRLRRFLHKRGPKVAPTRIDALIDDAVALLGHDLRRERIRLVIEHSPDIPPVNIDAIQIEQVILNLMRNALESMKVGGEHDRTLTVRSSMLDEHAVRIELADTGPPVAPQIADRFFEPFFTTKPDGMGLGLSLSQSIIQSHGGRITATAHRAGGATFTITLPVQAADHHDKTDTTREP